MRRVDERSKAAEPDILEPEEARAGTKTGRVVLVSSLILAVIVMIVLLYRYWSPAT